MLKSIFLSALLGGVLATDVLVAFQFMFSRPLLAAGLCGAMLGEPGAGLAMGCLMELIWAGALPVGSVVPPDFSLTAVFATASAVLTHSVGGLDWEACLIWSLLWSIPLAWAAGHADQAQRRWHQKLSDQAMAGVMAGDEAALGRAIGKSLFMAFGRGFVLTFGALLILVKPMLFLLERIAAPADEALHWMYWLALLLGFVVVMDLFWERRWLRACAISFFASAVLAYGFGVNGKVLLSLATFGALGAAVVFERKARA